MLECMELWSVIRNKSELMNSAALKAPKLSESNRSKHSSGTVWRQNLPPSAQIGHLPFCFFDVCNVLAFPSTAGDFGSNQARG